MLAIRKHRLRPLAALAAIALLAARGGASEPAPCASEGFEGVRYTVCGFDPARSDLRVFWRDGSQIPYRRFRTLAGDLAARGVSLEFAMNGGMYDADLRPIGLLIEEGRQIRGANTADPPAGVEPVPNFYKKPNGIFYVTGDGAGVMETERFLERKPAALYATQSGPLLLIDGAVHPAFIVGSRDRKRRNGVGVCAEGTVRFAISEGRVNFHDFARFFRDRLGCDNALFLDGGTAPGLYAPELRRDDRPGHGGYGPIIGAVRKLD